MKVFSPRWLAVLLVLCGAMPAMAQQKWYIHAQLGNDQNDGHSPATPFRTLARWSVAFNNNETTAGDSVILSGTFREFLNINMADPPHPQGLTFRRWDARDENPLNLLLTQPVFRGDVPLTGWTRAGNTARYVAPAGVGLSLQSVVWNWDFFVDEFGRNLGHLRKVLNPAAVEATPYSWYYDGSNLHVNVTPAGMPAADPAGGTLAYIPRGPNGGLTVQSGDGIVFDGLDAYLWLNDLTGTYGFSMEHATNSVIRNCRTRDTSHHGMGFTGRTGPGNTIEDCEVRGLMGLVGDNAGDCFGMLSNNTDITGCRVRRCTAHCYSLMNPDGTAVNPARKIHGFRTGTTQSGRFVRDLDVDDLTVVSYYPACNQFSTPVRIEDALAPTNPLDEGTYGLRFHRLRVSHGGYLNIAGVNYHAAFVDCDLNFSECSLRGLQNAGAIASAVSLGVDRKVLFKDCRISANVDNPNGRWYSGAVVTLQGATSLAFLGCTLEETGLRARGSTALFFGWMDPAGTIIARDSTFSYVYPRGTRRLCAWDAAVGLGQRDFAGCIYANLSPGLVYTDWYGPAVGSPDIRDEVGWLSNVEGDPYGVATGLRTPVLPSGTVTPGGNEADDRVK